MKLYDNDSVREDFMETVYELLADDPTNDRANQIIAAFDAIPPLEARVNEIPFEELENMDRRSVYVVNWDDPSLNGWAVIYIETILDVQILWLKFLDRKKGQHYLVEKEYHNPWVTCHEEPGRVQKCAFASGDRYRRLKADYDALKEELDALKAARNAGQ